MATKEKFKEAKRLYETANADQRYVLESLFPELRESEDERIREELIETIHLAYDCNHSYCCLRNSRFTETIIDKAQKGE